MVEFWSTKKPGVQSMQVERSVSEIWLIGHAAHAEAPSEPDIVRFAHVEHELVLYRFA